METMAGEGLGIALITLGIVFWLNRAGYLFFMVGPRMVLGIALAAIGRVVVVACVCGGTQSLRTMPYPVAIW